MKEIKPEAYFNLFKDIFLRELLVYSKYLYYQDVCIDYEWSDKMVENTINLNDDFKSLIIDIIDDVVSDKVDTSGGAWDVSTSVKNGDIGFVISSGYSDSMLDDMEPDAEAESKQFFDDEFMQKLNSFEFLNELNKNNLHQFLQFSIEEGRDHYIRVFNPKSAVWQDITEFDNDEEFCEVLYDFFDEKICSNPEFNELNDRIQFNEDIIKYYSSELAIIQDREFIPLSSVRDIDSLKYDLSKLPIIK
jgi:hypothetical protein